MAAVEHREQDVDSTTGVSMGECREVGAEVLQSGLMDTIDAAHYLGLTESAFRSRVARGEIEAFRRWRRMALYRREDLQRYGVERQLIRE